MKIISDFDDVLFDNKKLKEIIFSNLLSVGISRHLSEKRYKELRDSGVPFSLKEFLREFAPDDALVDELYESIMVFCKGLVNKEVRDAILSIGQENVYILTTGEEEYQRDKIRRSLGDTFSNVRVVPGLKSEEVAKICTEVLSDKASKHDDIIFVDDKDEHFKNLRSNEDFASHLKTVLFSQYGLETLRAEMEESKREEMKRKGENMGNMNENNKMR